MSSPRVNDQRKMIETEKALMQALQRLMAGKPRHDINIALAADGRLRITPSSVAREAGRSRTNIGSEECPYPHVREAVLAAMDRGNVASEGRPSAAELVDRLRRDKAVLENHVRVLATRLNDAFLQIHKLQKECQLPKDDRR